MDIDYNLVFESLLIQQEEIFGNCYDPADVPLVQELIIGFGIITTNRTQRLSILGEIVNRPLGSTKDLKVGEVHALLKLLDNPTFVTAMKETIS